MNYYVQYHNVDREGILLDAPPFSETRRDIRTRRPEIRHADGQVLLIAGVGQPRTYFLWETFVIDSIRRRGDGEFVASGEGWQLAPPKRLQGRVFEQFRVACANFVGFRCITDLPYRRTLCQFADDLRPPGKTKENVRFIKLLLGLLHFDSPDKSRVQQALDHFGDAQPTARERVLAQSIRQPHAEAILRGIKNVEYRNRPTNVRGRVLIYAAQKRNSAGQDAAFMAEYGIRDVTSEDLPRGVLVGSVEIHDCDCGKWHVRNPKREKHRKPTRQPQPSWFRPFE